MEDGLNNDNYRLMHLNAKLCTLAIMTQNTLNTSYDQILEISRSEKDLSVNIDDSLKFHLYIAAAMKSQPDFGDGKEVVRHGDAATISALYK